MADSGRRCSVGGQMGRCAMSNLLDVAGTFAFMLPVASLLLLST